MERNHYFENYINNLQKDIFLLAYDSGYDIVAFISTFMKSDIRRQMDKEYSSWHNQPAVRIFAEIAVGDKNIAKVQNQTINRSAVEWLGFFYSKWHFLTGEPSKIIVRFLNPIKGLNNYYTFHQLDESDVIEKCKRAYNSSRNAHRKYENVLNEESQNIYDDPIYYSFLSKRLLYKLTKNPIFKNIQYCEDDSGSYFVDNSYSFALKSNVIFKNDPYSIIDVFKKDNTNVQNGLKRSENTLYFCFIFSRNYELDDEQNTKVLIELNNIRKMYPPKMRNFNYLYFYILGNIYEITPSNEIHCFNTTFSKRERAGIINEMKILDL